MGSSKYDDLLAAEDKALKSNKGLHAKKEQTSRRIADVSGDVAKSKQFLPFLQRDRTMPGGVFQEGDPFGNEATTFIKEQIMQKEVEIEVETIDKGGNFIGWCFDGINNISVQLLEEGFASAFIMGGDRSNYASQIQSAEESAKRRKVRRWANYNEEEANKELAKVDEDKE